MIENNSKYGMTPEKAAMVFPSSHESRLKKLRVGKGFSQQGLADAAGVKKRLIQTYEQGERNINNGQIDSLCDLCIALGCRLEDIVEDEKLAKKLKSIK